MTSISPEPTTVSVLDRDSAPEASPQSHAKIERSLLSDKTDRRSKKSIWSSLRVKATLLAMAIGTLPVIAIGGVAYYFANQSISQQITATQKGRATLLSDKVNNFMAERYSDIQTIANLPVLRDPKLQAVATTTGQQEALDRLATIFDVYDSIAVYGLNGKLIVNSTNGLPTPDISSFEVFKSVLTNEIPYISKPEESEITSNKVITIVAPVKEKGSDKLIAVALARLPITFIDDAVKTFAEAGNDYYIADATGKIFITNKTDILGKDLTASFAKLDDLVARKQTASLVTNRQPDNVQRLVGYTAMPKFGNLPLLNWSALQSVSTDVAFKPQRDLLLTLGVGTGVAALLVGALAVLLANRFAQPIVKASSAVEKLGQGDLDTRLQVRGNDELAVLGANINQMAGQIQSLLETQRQNAEQLALQNDTLRELAKNDGLLVGDVSVAAKAFTEATARTLDIARVSVWFYNNDRNILSSFDLFDNQTQQHTKEVDLKTSDFPIYFQTLEREPSIVADDAYTHPATSEFAEVYLKPLDIASMLDIPIQSAGRTIGTVRCEQIGTPRQWKAEEQSFVTSISNLLSLAKESELLQGEVGDLLDVVSAVEDGDLTTRAQVSDRTTGLVADTFNRLLEQLGEVLGQVQTTSQQVSAGAINLEDLAQTVAINADRQAQEVAQVLSLTKQVEQSSQNAGEQVDLTNRALQEARSEVEQGQASISELNDGIEVLRQGTDRIVQGMKTLGEFVGLAEQFVQEQGQIASLTQVLALNATLVAARASEQKDPRKFGVVAREFEAIAGQVGNLAQQTNSGLESLQQRTSQINEVVSNIDTVVQGLGSLVNGFTKGVEESNQVFRNIDTTTGEVVKAGELVTQSNQEVLKAAQVTAKAMRDIADIANTTALLTQSTRSQTEQMENLSQQLLQRIQFFQLPSEMIGDDFVNQPVDIAQSLSETVTENSSESSKVPSFAEVAASL
jgi:twitching motility protein PilJ